MSARGIIGPAISVCLACAMAFSFFDHARLPDLFPWSGVMLPALLTGLLALGVGLLLPNRLHFTRDEHLRHQLYTATGLTGASSQRIVDHVEQARDLARRLRTASGEMQENTADVAKAAAADLDAIAERLLKEPDRATSATTLVTRAKVVVDAVDHFVDYKRDMGAQSAEVADARAQIIESLSQMSQAADAVQTRLARQKLTDVEVATGVADGLFRRPKR